MKIIAQSLIGTLDQMIMRFLLQLMQIIRIY